MNAVTKILDKILGKIPARGTLMTPSGTEEYPIAISNEIMGGPFVVDNIEELKEIPVSRLIKGCKCTVNEHEDINEKTVPTRTYILRYVPTTTLSKLESVNVSDYWKLDKPQQEEESATQYQYAPNYEGLKPPFINSIISTDAYNAGYATNEDYNAGDTSKIIWEDDYDLATHEWVRQRRGLLADWGIPVKINSGYEEGTYNDVRFLWKPKVDGAPARPSSLTSDGTPNNEPEGWLDTPEIPTTATYETYIEGNNLWKINAIKGVYGDLESNWSDPVLVSTDPNLVRYGLDPNNDDYFNETYWRGYYSEGDKYKATRATVDSDWVITMIAGESGEYTDFVFKQFEDSYEPTLDDRPKTELGINPTEGWFDGVFVPDDGYTIYVSTAKKYSDGSLVSGWSIPKRFDGKSTTRAIVTPVGNNGTAFKFTTVDGVKSVTPTSISLEAKLWDANNLITPTNYTVDWYIGDIETGVKVASGVPDAPIMSGTNNYILTIDDTHVSGNQVFTARIWLEGEDYIDDITIYDVTDGLGYIPLISSESGFTFKGTETKTFTGYLYENGVNISTASGVTYEWFLNNVSISNERTTTVSDTDVDQINNLKLNITVTQSGITYTVIEALTDVADGKSYERQYSALEELVDPASTPDSINNVNNWTTSAEGAVWVIERLEGEDWGDPYRIKGEKGDPNGAFQKTIYRLYDPDFPPSPDWRSTKPTEKTDENANLTPTDPNAQSVDFDWKSTPPTTTKSGVRIYGSTATFLKNPNTEDTEEFVKNWNITSAKWSLPFQITYFAADGTGTPGDAGNDGWSPILATEGIGTGEAFKQVIKINDWVGGTDPGTKPNTGYITPSGIEPQATNSVNIKGYVGPQGPKGEDGVFNAATDFWETNTYTIDNVSPIYNYSDQLQGYTHINILFKKSKIGSIYYTGAIYATNIVQEFITNSETEASNGVINITLPIEWVNSMSPLSNYLNYSENLNYSSFDLQGKRAINQGSIYIRKTDSTYFLVVEANIVYKGSDFSIRNVQLNGTYLGAV